MNVIRLVSTALLIVISTLPLRGADLVVSAQIDGHSRLVISTGDSSAPAQILWDHLSGLRPGTSGGPYPTILSGYQWFPKWPGTTPNGSPSLCTSLLFTPMRFPTNGVSLTQQAGRTAVTIVQQPVAGNAFTLVVDFDDSTASGADQYVVTLRGVSFALLELLTPQRFSKTSGYQFTITGNSNVIYAVEKSTNLIDWQWLISVQSLGTPVSIIDLSATNSTSGFYRMRARR